jgi:hypothetical protein
VLVAIPSLKQYNQDRHGQGIRRRTKRQLLRRGYPNLARFDRPRVSSWESPEAIRQNFALLSLEEVYGATAYYLAHQAPVGEYLTRQDEKWSEGRRTAEPMPANLRAGLPSAREDMHAARP